MSKKGRVRWTTSARQWLRNVEFEDWTDPNVLVLIGAAQELDDLDSTEMTDSQRATAARSLRHSFTTARKTIQAQLDKADSLNAIKRHQLMFAGVACSSLGFIDPQLLSAELRKQVYAHLKSEHNIDAAEFEPIIVELG